LKLRNAVDLYLHRWRKPKDQHHGYDLSHDPLTETDWAELQLYVNLLKPFKNLTKHMEGIANKLGSEGAHGAIWESLKSMDFMFKHLKQEADAIVADADDAAANEGPPKYLSHYSSGVDAGYLKLTEYYSLIDRTPLYRAAMVLHPRWKFDYFEENWKDHKDWIASCRVAVQQL
jgi:hypothetical protein